MDLINDSGMTCGNVPRATILIVAGESSGEAHAAGLLRELRSQAPQTSFDIFGSGGEQMASEGVELFLDVSALAAIGPWAALANTRNYLWLYRELIKQARSRKPDLAILVDFPDFNLRLARKLKSMGISICYFISPQVWAWRRSRVKQIKRYVDLMLVIFPFEEEFFRSHGVEVHYVGNPSVSRFRRLAASQETTRVDETSSEGRSLVALLPGSRKKEVEQILPVELDAAQYLQERHPTRFCVVKAPAVNKKDVESIYQTWLKKSKGPLELEIRGSNRREALQQADCAIVKSGTSTLEAMLWEIPFAMVYRISYFSWLLLRPFVRTTTYCLANLVAGSQIVPEFVQKNATGERIGAYILTLLEDSARRSEIKERLSQARQRLGNQDAYSEGARQITMRFFREGGADI